MIVCFSGTGNSLALAKTMACALNDQVFFAPDAIRTGERPSFFSDKPYVFVCPTYGWRIPRVFEAFLRDCGFGGNQRAYFVLDCGSDIGAAGKYTRALAREKGLSYFGTIGIRQGCCRTRLHQNCRRRTLCREEANAAGSHEERRRQQAVLPAYCIAPKIPRDRPLHRLWKVRSAVHARQHSASKQPPCMGRSLHALHGLHRRVPNRRNRVRPPHRRPSALLSGCMNSRPTGQNY